MLAANLQGIRVDATSCEKGPSYECPRCQREVVLKKGRIKIAHFAHKPPTDCSWASAETQAHLGAKVVLRDAFRAMGYMADYEVPLLSTGGDRRADVLVKSPDGRRQWAIEVQHTPILYDAMESRTKGYMAANAPVLWLGILSPKMRDDASPTSGGMLIRQYTIRPWEKWAQALAFGELWYIDPAEGTLWRGTFSDYLIHVEATSWFESGGEERYAGGYSRRSKKWRTLMLEGPYYIHQVHLESSWRKAWISSAFNLPAGYFAKLMPGKG